jgi:hypothetical protein
MRPWPEGSRVGATTGASNSFRAVALPDGGRALAPVLFRICEAVTVAAGPVRLPGRALAGIESLCRAVTRRRKRIGRHQAVTGKLGLRSLPGHALGGENGTRRLGHRLSELAGPEVTAG